MSQPTEFNADATRHSLGFFAAFASLAIVSLAAAIDATIIAVALPAISADIHGSATEAFWAGTAFLLASTVFMLNWVTFSAVFGRRPIMLLACFILALGSIICAVSKSFTVMLIGRTVQGVGSGGFVAVVQVIITDMFPLRERAQYYALISTVYAIGSITAPIMGGALAQRRAWQWIFWLNLPIIGVGSIGLIAFLKLQYRERSLLTKLREIDYRGSFLFTASLTSFLIPVTWGGVMYSLLSWRTLVPMVLGIAGLAISIFKNRSTSFIFLGAFYQEVVLRSIAYYIPEYFQSIKGYSPTSAGLALLLLGCTTVPSAMFVRVVVGIVGRYRWAIWTGWTLTTMGFGVMILLDVHNTVVSWIFIELVPGIGIGILFPAIVMGIQASAPQEDTAIAATLGLFFRLFGQTIGVAVGGTIFQNRLRGHLEAIPSLANKAVFYASNSVKLIVQLKQMSLDSPVAIQLRTSFARSYRTIWIVMCALSSVALFFSLFVKEFDLNQAHLTDQAFIGDVKKRETEGSGGETVATGIDLENGSMDGNK